VSGSSNGSSAKQRLTESWEPQLALTEQHMTFDVDDLKPDDWIARLLRPS
jgi:hypothetical protein